MLHERAVQKIREFVTTEFSCDWHGVIPSPITGTDGNQEFLAWITIPKAGIPPIRTGENPEAVDFPT